MIFMEFLLTLVFFGALAFYRLDKMIWPPVAIVGFVLVGLFAHLPWWLLAAEGLVLGAAVSLVLLPQLRQLWLTKPMLQYLQGALPPIGDTERIALEAGDTWWDKELFCGTPNWHELRNLPKPTLSAEEQAFLDNETTTLCSMLDDWQINHRGDFPQEIWDFLKDKGFFSLIIPKRYGGLEFSPLAHAAIIAKVGSVSAVAGVTVTVPNSLGPAELLLMYGTEAQKQHYLPRLAKGQEIPCFALTSPLAGSDAGSIPDTGIVCRGEHDGQETLGIKLTFDKHYITLAPIATVIGLAFKLKDPDKLLGECEDLGITLCLLPRSHPGLKIGQYHSPLGTALCNGSVQGSEVFIPLDWIIGGPQMAGQGWRMLMECLSVGRSISLPGIANGICLRAYRMTGAYAAIRHQFKLPIAKFEGVRYSLGRIAGLSYLVQAVCSMTAHAAARGLKPSLLSAITKYHTTEMHRQVVNDAMDVHGGRGIQMGPRNYLATAHLSVPIAITVEGANILTRSLMIFGQGAMRCHPYLRAEIECAMIDDSTIAIEKFDKLLLTHLGYTLRNCLRTIAYGVTGGVMIRPWQRGVVARYQRQLTRMSAALAFCGDIALLLLGGDLKRKECLSARLGDVLSHLYMASAVMKYYHDNGSSQSEQGYFCWAMEHCLNAIYEAFSDFLRNFTWPRLARFLRWLIFPWGRPYHAPTDTLQMALVETMVTPGELRERLTSLCYRDTDAKRAMGRVEEAFSLLHTVEQAKEKMNKAITLKELTAHKDLHKQVTVALEKQVITQQEAEDCRRFADVYYDMVIVDSFAKQELQRT